MYTQTNFTTKKQLKEAIAAGDHIGIFQPGGMFNPAEGKPDYTGTAIIEGPHYPKPHIWYAEATLVNGIIIKVK
jgi:hypothetical protein